MPEVCNICGSLLENSPQDYAGGPRVLWPRESPPRALASSIRNPGGSGGVPALLGVAGAVIWSILAAYGLGTLLGQVLTIVGRLL